MKKVLNIIGARPQFIKAAMLSRAIRDRNDLKEIILHTGQHYDQALSGDILTEIGFPGEDYNLGINQVPHGAMVGRILEETEKILLAERPDVVVVYGDTNSTLAGALAARKLNINVAHVEAGMRSNNERMPEETNRILTDRMSRLLFCSSDTAVKNLEQEGYLRFNCSIINSGDLMYDAFKHFSTLTDIHSSYFRGLALSEFVLCTIHRESNVDDFEQLSEILKQLDIINRELPVVVPLHPRTIKNISAAGLETKVKLLPPVSYLQMLHLLKKCALVITDSGGLQREAYFAGKPCMVLRTETEWIELIESGYSVLVGNNLASMQAHYRYLMENPPDFQTQLYGNGKAAEIIAKNLIMDLSGS